MEKDTKRRESWDIDLIAERIWDTKWTNLWAENKLSKKFRNEFPSGQDDLSYQKLVFPEFLELFHETHL